MRLRSVFYVIGVAALLAMLLAATGPARARDGGDPEQGAELYFTYCYVCHGERGEGRTGASLSQVYGGISPSIYLADVITGGVAGTFMPAWGQGNGGPLTANQIADIVAYVESWGTTVEPPAPAPPHPEVDIPPVPEVDGDPNTGYGIFQRECAGCHGDRGQGQVGANLTNAFAAISPDAFAIETVSRGVAGSLMPPFAQDNGGPLTEQEINDVAAYVLSIQREATPSGGETVGQASGLPLALAIGAVILVIIVLGIAVQRRESRRAGGG